MAERRSVAADVVGSKPTSRPKIFPGAQSACWPGFFVSRIARLPRRPILPPNKSRSDQRLFAGTSGWAYPSWKPEFYPAKLPARRFLEYYSSVLNSVEVNYTFRALPSPAQLAQWLAATGEGFRFSFKAPQRITHFSRLRDCEPHLQAFLAAIAPIAEAGRMGLVLVQLPPTLKADTGLLRDFLACPSLLAAPPLAFEFRHESWFSDDVYTTLADHRAALCIADTDDLQTPEVHCAPTHTCFRLRRHGGYTARDLAAFARRFTALARGRDVYSYFRHEDEPTGALNAMAFRELAGKTVIPTARGAVTSGARDDA